ncbi:MAG: 2-dehydropantoate 2-reductase [Variibacter sp.]|nr:2-dehydropantoate 2-reductase [Variibacter sp.]
MRIAALAAGGVGGYFGARLAAAGHDVTFIARGAHLDAIRRDGIRLESVLGDVHIPDAKATPDPASVGPVDVVLFAVKLWDTEKAGELARPLIGPATRLITFQNGVDSVERLRPILGDQVVGGVTYIATVIDRPGVIKQTSSFARARCGRPGNAGDPQLEAFVKAGQAAGIDIALSEDIEVERWKKFISLVTMSAATSSTRCSIGHVVADPEVRAFFVKVMAEVIAVARASDVRIPGDMLEQGEKFLQAAPFGMKASMAHDLERGNRLELDWLSGKVVSLGRELGVPTPANEAVYAILKLHRFGPPAER